MTINISQEDFGTLCICALRYCHGRKTYMPSLVQGIVRQNFEHLSAKDLDVIKNDKDFQASMNLWGDACDKADWERFYNALNEYVSSGKQKIDYLLDASGSDDITFCTASCQANCARKPEHIKEYEIPHSFSDFSSECASYKEVKNE